MAGEQASHGSISLSRFHSAYAGKWSSTIALMKRMPPLWFLFLVSAYIAVAVVNRQFSWAWGREWVAPTMMLGVLAATLFLSFPGCRRWDSRKR